MVAGRTEALADKTRIDIDAGLSFKQDRGQSELARV